MLTELGVDRVIAVDLQRPGQGHEACFFDNRVPLEVVSTNDLFIDHILKKVDIKLPLVVVSSNAECVKRAYNYQNSLKSALGKHDDSIRLAAFFSADVGTGRADVSTLELLGNAKISGSDVLVVDDVIDTARR